MAFPSVTGFAPVCQSSMAEAVCLSSTSVLSEKPPSVCAYQCSTGRCSCTSQAPLKTISALFESGFLGNSMLRQKIHWAVPSTPQVEMLCCRKQRLGVSSTGVHGSVQWPGSRSLWMQQTDKLLAPALLSFIPSPSSWTCATIGTHQKCPVTERRWCGHVPAVPSCPVNHPAGTCRHQGLQGM